MKEKVIELIAEHFSVQPSELSLETDLSLDLHADSLDMVELIMAFEDTFDVTISDDDALSVHTVGDVVRSLESARS